MPQYGNYYYESESVNSTQNNIPVNHVKHVVININAHNNSITLNGKNYIIAAALAPVKVKESCHHNFEVTLNANSPWLRSGVNYEPFILVDPG